MRPRTLGDEKMSAAISITGNLAQVQFSQFDLETYKLFLKAKTLPESSLDYDWELDSYTLKTPSRFAQMLGADIPVRVTAELLIALHLWDYQQFIVKQALASKRYAIFADCGLGKTAMFLEWMRQVQHITGGKVMIFSPLQIVEQTREEGLLGPESIRTNEPWQYSQQLVRLETREQLVAWLTDGKADAGICNYEKLIDGLLPELRNLAGLVLDESSILKSGGGVIKWNLIKSAKGIEYKLSCTATPAPNDIMEYASQAAFLEKLRNEGEILWTYFSRDKNNNWKIKPHAREGFYRFMASWSIYLRNPSHYGWADNLSQIPAPEFHVHELAMTPAQHKQAHAMFARTGAGLFGDKKMGIAERSKLSQIAKGFIYEKQDRQDKEETVLGSLRGLSSSVDSVLDTDQDGLSESLRQGGLSKVRKPQSILRKVRCIKSAKPQWVADTIEREVKLGRQTLVWTVFDEESEILWEKVKHLKRGAVLDGKTPKKEVIRILEAFRHGQIDWLISKASLLGFGLNFQFIGAMIFSGWDDSYERWYQAIKRGQRYGRTTKLQIHIPYIPELEGAVYENILRKQANFERDAEEQEKYYREALKGLVAA